MPIPMPTPSPYCSVGLHKTAAQFFFALALAHAAHATCEPPSRTVFSCLTATGQLIQVCDAASSIDYSFGLPKVQPEILVRAPRGSASSYQWQGAGRYISYSLTVPSGDTQYTVFWGTDRLSDEHPVEAGVYVEVKGKLVATVQCAGESGLVQNIEGIDLKASE